MITHSSIEKYNYKPNIVENKYFPENLIRCEHYFCVFHKQSILAIYTIDAAPTFEDERHTTAGVVESRGMQSSLIKNFANSQLKTSYKIPLKVKGLHLW